MPFRPRTDLPPLPYPEAATVREGEVDDAATVCGKPRMALVQRGPVAAARGRAGTRRAAHRAARVRAAPAHAKSMSGRAQCERHVAGAGRACVARASAASAVLPRLPHTSFGLTLSAPPLARVGPRRQSVVPPPSCAKSSSTTWTRGRCAPPRGRSAVDAGSFLLWVLEKWSRHRSLNGAPLYGAPLYGAPLYIAHHYIVHHFM